MALPPLIYLAAGRGVRRVVLVGDFFQLPPIVRGTVSGLDKESSALIKERLGTDIFQLAGVVKEQQPNPACGALTKLDVQHSGCCRRLLPLLAI